MASTKTLSSRKIFIATGIALVANILIYVIASAAGATWNVGMPFTVSVFMVAGATVVPMLLGWLIVRAIAKRSPAVTTWAAWLVLAFSVAGAPSGWLASQEVATGLALGAMHIVVGLAWFFSIKSAKH